jgi:hypothetical protein
MNFKLLSMFINGYQIDIQTIILYNDFGAQNNYQHIYYVRNGFSGNDAPTNCSFGSECSDTFVNPCSTEPCLNGGTCVIGYNLTYCLCLKGFKGKINSLKSFFFIYILRSLL